MKVEKVVKEPKNPTPKKSWNDLEEKISSLIKNPINRHPVIFISKVLAANPKIEKLYEKTALACKKYNKWHGSGGVKDEKAAKNYIAMGANFFLAGQDIGFLLSASKDRVDRLKS